MGVGLEAGLSIDAMADELATLLDRADAAALSGDIDELVDALGGLGCGFRRKSATDSDLKSATDSEAKPATRSGAIRPPIPI